MVCVRGSNIWQGLHGKKLTYLSIKWISFVVNSGKGGEGEDGGGGGETFPNTYKPIEKKDNLKLGAIVIMYLGEGQVELDDGFGSNDIFVQVAFLEFKGKFGYDKSKLNISVV